VPNQPKLNLPADGSVLDGTQVQRFSWTFSDDDAGDSQSKFDLRYSSDGGAHWTTVTRTTPNQYYDVLGGTLADGSYQWQVRTYDALGVVGAWSPSLFFTVAETPGAPTITYPASGGTVGSDDEVDWSTPVQEAFRVILIRHDTATNTDVTYFDSGEIEDPDARSYPLSFPVSGDDVSINVTIRNDGLWSSPAAVEVLVSFLPPPTPTVKFGTAPPGVDDDLVTALDVVWQTPDPPGDGSAAPAQWVDVYLSTDGGVTSQLYAANQPVSGSWRFETPASGVDYWVQVVAHANASAQAASPWTLQ
jgi:hypothetical protein